MKKLLLLVTMLCLTLLAQAQVSKTINIATAGTLSTALTADEKATITNLTLTGTIDARDFKTMRDDMPVLAVIDLSNTTIAEYTGINGTYSSTISYLANQMPVFAFCNGTTYKGKSTLTSFVFPSSATTIGGSAFRDCSGLTGSLTIPSSVTSIGSWAFQGCSGLTGSLTIPSSVTDIGYAAFYGCSGLTGSLTIPSSVTYIDNEAFRSCSGFTGSLTIPTLVTYIGYAAFQNCSGFTGSLTIPASVTSIADCAFQNCSGFIGSLTIPASVTSIGKYAFSGCSGFTGSLTIPASVTSIANCAFQKCSGFTGSLTIPASVTSIEVNAFEGCSGFTGSLTIPASVTSIGAGAFGSCGGIFNIDSNNLNYSSEDGVLYNKNKTNIIQCPKSKAGSFVIPSSVTSIGTNAFRGCSSFTGSLTIPASVTSIGDGAFAECSGFTGSLTIPSSVTSIGSGAFYYCSGFTGSLIIPSSITSIEHGAFSYCSGFTGSLTIPSSVTSIGNNAFYFCTNFTGSLTIPASVTSIGELAFYPCRGFTGSLAIPSSVTSIGRSAFAGCSGIINVDSNNSNFSSVDGVLYNKNKTTLIQCPISRTGSFEIPSSVTSIGESAFSRCTKLSTITIPANVTTIEANAFANCNGLQNISVSQATPIDLTNSSSVFYGVDKTTCELHVPDGTLAKYKVADKWKDFTTIIEARYIVPGKLASTYTPAELATMTTLTLDGIIDARDFKTMRDDMPMLTTIDLSNATIVEYTGWIGTLSREITTYSADQIPSNAFYNSWFGKGKNILTSISLPSSITAISSSAFKGCSGLTTISIPANVATIGANAFDNCKGLQNISVSQATPIDLTNSSSVFYGVAKTTCVLNVPNGSLDKYKVANQWKDFTKIIEPRIIDPGKLASTYTPAELASMTTVTLTGFIDARDFKIMRDDMPNLTAINISSATIAEYTGMLGTLGSAITTYPANQIPTNAFYTTSLDKGKSVLTSISLASSITAISSSAFNGCSGLTTISIPANVATIEANAFANCNGLQNISVSQTTPIDLTNSSSVFYGVAKTTCVLNVPNGTLDKYKVANQWKDFTKIIEPRFIAPGKLSTTFTATELAMISAIAPTGDIDARDFKTMRDDMPMLRIIDLSNANIVEYTGMLGTFGNDIITYSANKIPTYAFYKGTSSVVNSVLTSIILPASITVIGTSAFQNCTSLSAISIPANVTTIDKYAFYNCKGLQEVTVSQSTPIDLTNSSSVFFGVDKTTCMLNVPDGTLAKYKIANQWKDFTTIIEPSFITLGKIASTYTPTELASMTTLTLEGNIDARDFKTMRDDMPKLTSIDLSNATIVEYMGMLGTLSKDITTYSANQIPADAFFNAELNMGKSELSSVILPTTITSIDSSAFNGCSGLTTVSIPTSVTSLGTKAFANCLGLQKIYVYETTPLDLTNSATVFAGVNKRTCELHIPDGTLAIYRAANQWGEFIRLRESDTALKTIEDVSVTVFPNPVKENFRVTGLDGVFTVTLLDITGNTVLTQEASANESISMSSFPAGSYLLLIKTERGTICKMITKR